MCLSIFYLFFDIPFSDVLMNLKDILNPISGSSSGGPSGSPNPPGPQGPDLVKIAANHAKIDDEQTSNEQTSHGESSHNSTLPGALGRVTEDEKSSIIARLEANKGKSLSEIGVKYIGHLNTEN